MKSSRSRWVSGIGAVVLIGGLVLATGGGVTHAGKNNNPPPPPNPFTAILAKLDEILAAIAGIGGGGGEGNHTLRWDTNNPSASRFTTAFTGAVLDKNTGLVWEQAPDANARLLWAEATSYCARKSVGNTVGWRLPSVIELKSVQDPLLPGPFVPASVFTGVPPIPIVPESIYWSATTFAGDPTVAWTVSVLVGGGLGSVDNFYIKTGTPRHAWCVRGPMQESVY